MNKKDSLRALCYRLRASHGRALNYEYILPVESGGEENDGIPQEDWVMLITTHGMPRSVLTSPNRKTIDGMPRSALTCAREYVDLFTRSLYFS
jgi:hypothetical protein